MLILIANVSIFCTIIFGITYAWYKLGQYLTIPTEYVDDAIVESITIADDYCI